MSLRLGLDLGGTNIKVALVDADRLAEGDGWLVATDTVPTKADLGPEAVTSRMIEIASGYPQAATIGVGVPGVFDKKTGAIELFPNLPGPWKGFPLLAKMTAGLGRSSALINDARAFTLAEGTVGAGRGAHTLVCVTLGTGIGGGVMIEGRVHLGGLGTAGEIAHQIVVPDGPLCGCGNRGCAEPIAKAEAVAARAGKRSIEEVYAAVRAGDEMAVEAVEYAARYLGISLANAVALLAPDRIVIGGGIVQAGDIVIEPIQRALREHLTLVPPASVEVVAASLGPNAGAIGAALA
ncbi:MAG: ROK family protein [Actinobacteria bacterium]|nr:ROK family protein [Acidimicrobiia bacterium]MCA1735921.1 ROK family protein [Actinomycetota bacterium]MDQ3500162.1 ROK family protein [Actinomycetota bacterium]